MTSRPVLSSSRRVTAAGQRPCQAKTLLLATGDLTRKSPLEGLVAGQLDGFEGLANRNVAAAPKSFGEESADARGGSEGARRRGGQLPRRGTSKPLALIPSRMASDRCARSIPASMTPPVKGTPPRARSAQATMTRPRATTAASSQSRRGPSVTRWRRGRPHGRVESRQTGLRAYISGGLVQSRATIPQAHHDQPTAGIGSSCGPWMFGFAPPVVCGHHRHSWVRTLSVSRGTAPRA